MVNVIVTTVGTSIFDNIINNPGSTVADIIEDKYPDIKLLSSAKYLNEEPNKNKGGEIINFIQKYHFDDLEKYSAEVKSIDAIIKELKINSKDVKIYPICTDSAPSVVSAEILDLYYKKNRPGINFLFDMHGKRDQYIISGLQIKDEESFKNEGLNNLFDVLLNVYKQSIKNNEEIRFNITGGYKAIVPYMVLFAQTYKIPTYYIFEESEVLIEIPILPIEFDYSLLEDNFTALEAVGKTKSNRPSANELKRNYLPNEKADKIFKELVKKNVIMENGLRVEFTPIGKVMWNRFVERYQKNRNLNVNAVVSLSVELLFYEYMIEKFPDAKVKHSKKIDGNEVDVYVEDKNQIIACEIKPGNNIPIEQNGSENTIERLLTEGSFKKIFDSRNKKKKISLRIYFYSVHPSLPKSVEKRLQRVLNNSGGLGEFVTFYIIQVPSNYKSNNHWKINDKRIKEIEEIKFNKGG